MQQKAPKCKKKRKEKKKKAYEEQTETLCLFNIIIKTLKWKKSKNFVGLKCDIMLN